MNSFYIVVNNKLVRYVNELRVIKTGTSKEHAHSWGLTLKLQHKTNDDDVAVAVWVFIPEINSHHRQKQRRATERRRWRHSEVVDGRLARKMKCGYTGRWDRDTLVFPLLYVERWAIKTHGQSAYRKQEPQMRNNNSARETWPGGYYCRWHGKLFESHVMKRCGFTAIPDINLAPWVV